MQNFNQFIKDFTKLIAINSERTPAIKDMPFGEGVKKALDCFLEIAQSLGFNTINHQNYIGEISYGEGEEIGIIGHLDVVPASNNWNTPPYTLTQIGNNFYGRGTSDDKGPTLICLYALKSVIDSGIKFNKKIRFFVGTNEESGWEDIEYCKKNNHFPQFGFSPDGEFPVSYAEKGMYEVIFTLPSIKNFCDISGGSAINAVCDYASATPKFIPKQKDLEKFNLYIDNKKVCSKGVSAHGSTPHLGKNAIRNLFEYFVFCGEDLKNAIECFFNDKHGIFNLKNEQGEVTFSPNLISQNQKGEMVVSLDLRIPAPFTIEMVKEKLNQFGYAYKIIPHHPPMMADSNGWFVKALINAYNSTMQQNLTPVSMGGSTYARAFKMGCAFGGAFPNDTHVAHMPNEFITKDSIFKQFEIYKKAIENLVK